MPGMKDIDFGSIAKRALGNGDDASRLLATAAKELRDGKLTRVEYSDELPSAPTRLTISILGVVDGGVFHQGFSIDHNEDEESEMLPTVRHLPSHGTILDAETVNDLIKKDPEKAETPIKTFAVLVIGHAGEGVGVTAAWHPKLSEAEAMGFMRHILGERLGEDYFAKHDPRNAN